MARACGCGRWELQKLADQTGLAITVCHFPPGTSKWNKIEHRLFSLHHPELARQAAGQPSQVIVNLIGATRTATGLRVHCELDTDQYPKGIAVSDAEMAAINITRADFHGDWNYTISVTPRAPSSRIRSRSAGASPVNVNRRITSPVNTLRSMSFG